MAFLDYNRTIVGYHGTNREQAERIVRTQQFKPSTKKDDWLGHGVYFWEYAPRQALRWAQGRYDKEAAIVASMIRLGNCLDLLDPDNAADLKRFHDDLESTAEREGKELPRNYNARKYRDCYVLEAFYSQETERIDAARGVYVPTPGANKKAGGGFRLWKQSWLTLDAHIQICIRPESMKACILGTWPVTTA